MKVPVRIFFFAALLSAFSAGLGAQTSNPPSGAFDMTGFPLWARDLRRAEIVTFGSFPFTYFFAATLMDLQRSSVHNWDPLYAPWPFKPAGAVVLTQDEYMQVIGGAAAASVLIALADYLIVRIKREKARQAEAVRASESPIIIRRPWPAPGEDPGAAPPPENP